MTARGQQLAVTATCLVAAVTYAGAVTAGALGRFVLPGVVIATAVAWPLVRRGLPGTALIVGGVVVLASSELVNIWSGSTEGPVARSTFFAAGWSLIALIAARSRWPALFLLAVAGVVAGAMVLGARSEVRTVAVAAAVCAALTLAWIERSRRNWTARPRRGAALVLLTLLSGSVAVVVVLLQAQHEPKVREATAAGAVIKPPWADPLGMPSNPPGGMREASGPSFPHNSPKPHSKQPRSGRAKQPKQSPKPTSRVHRQSTHTRIWLYVLAAALLFVLLLALAFAARLLVTRLAWRRVRRRLAAGTRAEQITGAWAWMRLRLEACRLPLAPAISPDKRAAHIVLEDLVAEAPASLRWLEKTATVAAFADDPSLAPADVTAAWKAARLAEASARARLTRVARVGLAFRGPVVGVGS